jgi:glyoxylase-like metal-dependent hydrolase (beta-lactamase superfamily II)
MCYLLERPGLRALFTGDVIQCLSLPSDEALGTYSAYLPPLYRGDARDYLGTLRRLRQLPLPDLVLPGHPRMDPVPQSPHLSEERWQTLLATGIARMEVLLAHYEADGANFLDGIPKQLLPGLYYLGNLGPSAVYCLSNAKGLFLFDAPGGPALVDFLARRGKELGWERRQPTAVLLTSADEEATAGLAALVQSTGCQVVAPKAGLQRVRRLCPQGSKVLTDEDLAKSSWFEVRAIPLGGRGVAPLAYQVRWAGKTVLLSGRILVKPSVAAAEDLTAEVTGPGGSSERYLKALGRLAEVNPDLWLPSLPVNGQNANVYDRDWDKVLSENRQLVLR